MAVVDTAEAVFEVDDYEDYVAIQSEAAIRTWPPATPMMTTKANPLRCGERQRDWRYPQGRGAGAAWQSRRRGIGSAHSYLPTRLKLPVMLQRQQASAIVAARSKIVEGAVSMVEAALDQLTQRQIIELDAQSKASMVSNLLVILCSDRAAQPVVNSSTPTT